MKGFWLFLFGALCGIAGTTWYLHRSSLPDMFESLRNPAPVTVQTVEDAAPVPASIPIPAPVSGPPEPDAAPQPDTAVATEPVPPPTTDQLVSPPVEAASAAPAAAAPATAPQTPAEKSITTDPVASEPIPPPESGAGQSAVPTPIADSYQAHPDALVVPVTGVTPDQLSDTFDDVRSADRTHEALDIMAPKGTPVVAVDDGKVVKLFNSVRGGLTLYQFDPGEKLAYYYAHLDSYAPGVAEGKVLKRGELIGHVGVTGNSNPDAPHLHFAVFELGAEKQWWKGTAINPYPLFKR